MTTDVQGDDVPAGVAAGDVAVGGKAVTLLANGAQQTRLMTGVVPPDVLPQRASPSHMRETQSRRRDGQMPGDPESYCIISF